MRITLEVEIECCDERMTHDELVTEASNALRDGLDAMGYREITVNATERQEGAQA